MGSALAVGREAVQASAEEQGFLVEEAVGPEDVVGDVEFECAAHGVGGGGDDEFGLAAEFLIPGFGHGVLAGGAVVDAAVAGGAGLAFRRTRAGGLFGVSAGPESPSDLAHLDASVGQFTSHEGKLVIEYDIGELEGEHGGMGELETLTEGFRVRSGRVTRRVGEAGTSFFASASFPDSGCANFYLESPREEDSAAIDVIAKSFRPRGGTPSWALPLLPEVVRSDCRYRFQLPVAFLGIWDRIGEAVDGRVSW